MFKLNSLFTIDGTTTGNESRYINHASGDNANVRAYGIYIKKTLPFDPRLGYSQKKEKTESKFVCFLTVRLVNSEHRIGIFACKNIKPGTELLLDYGSDFFFKTQAIPTSTAENWLPPRFRYLKSFQSIEQGSSLSRIMFFFCFFVFFFDKLRLCINQSTTSALFFFFANANDECDLSGGNGSINGPTTPGILFTDF